MQRIRGFTIGGKAADGGGKIEIPPYFLIHIIRQSGKESVSPVGAKIVFRPPQQTVGNQSCGTVLSAPPLQ